MILDIVLAILQIFGIFLIGWLARHLGYIREEELNRWSRFVVDFLMPLLVFHSIISDFERERLSELWLLPVVGLGMIVLGAVAGILLRRALKSHSPDLVRTFHHFCAINNYGFLPIIIVQNTMGAKALALLFFFNLGSTIGYWTIGVGLLGGASVREALRNIVNANLVALCLALVLALLGWNKDVPALVVNISGFAGAAAVPCMLILIGASLYPFPKLRERFALIYVTAVRLVVLPAVYIAVVLLLPLAADVERIALIVGLMPTSVSSTIITRRYGGDPDFAAQAAVVTTLLSVITVPCGLWLVQHIR